MSDTKTDWRDLLGLKLTTPDTAVDVVKDGDRVVIGMMHLTPLELCRALARRQTELRGVTVDASLSAFVKWWPHGEASGLMIESFFLLDRDRDLYREGKIQYRIAPPYRADLSRWTALPIDVFMTQVTPPDADGWCSFGMSVWGARGVATQAKTILAEINPKQVRTGGDNRIHIDEIDYFVETTPEWRLLRPPERNDEEAAVAQVICALVASELIHDGDTFQLGTGKVPAALSLFLGDKVDLGVHTELIFGGIPQLVEAGIITGTRKGVKRGVVVGSSFGQLTELERLLVAGRPDSYELHEMAWTNDLATIAAHDNMVAVNNALLADLTGQVTGESLGHRIYSGTGGGFAFPAGAMHAKGGRSVMVTPSTSIVSGERKSRIVGTLPPGTVVTVPRQYADYFVTEYGIAHMRNRTLRERVNEMIAVAHPDFRADLVRQSKEAGFM